MFLDLKYHDIPNTVAQACKAAAEMGVWMVDMHASGGRRMMEAAAEAVANCQNKPLLIGVTVLTSMTQQDLAETGGQFAQYFPQLSLYLWELGLPSYGGIGGCGRYFGLTSGDAYPTMGHLIQGYSYDPVYEKSYA